MKRPNYFVSYAIGPVIEMALLGTATVTATATATACHMDVKMFEAVCCQ